MTVPSMYEMFMYQSKLSGLAESHFYHSTNWHGQRYRDFYLTQRVVDKGFGKMDDINHGVVKFFTKDLISSPHDLFFPGTIGYKNKGLKKEKTNLAKSFGLKLVNILHPSVNWEAIPDSEAGLWIMENVVIQSGASVGLGCTIWPNVTISHDSDIMPYTWISPGATICGNVDIGEDCFIGAGAIISNDVVIGANSIIGAGAVITKNVQPNSVYGSGRNYKLDITADKVHLK